MQRSINWLILLLSWQSICKKRCQPGAKWSPTMSGLTNLQPNSFAAPTVAKACRTAGYHSTVTVLNARHLLGVWHLWGAYYDLIAIGKCHDWKKRPGKALVAQHLCQGVDNKNSPPPYVKCCAIFPDRHLADFLNLCFLQISPWT